MLIDPYKSVGDLFFTDSRQEIRRKLNEPFDFGVKEFEGSKDYYDWFKKTDVMVLYDENNKINAFEFYNSGPIFHGLDLKKEPFKNIFELFSRIDPDVSGNERIEFTSYKFGIGGGISYEMEEDIAMAESIIVFKKGYYDDLLVSGEIE